MASVVPDSVNGKVTVNWTNPLAQTNRIYIRQNGVAPTPAWVLLKNNIQGVNGANSIDIYDNVPIGIAMDYGVTGVNPASGIETPIGNLVISNVMIKPDYHWDTGGWNCLIHIVGNPTYRAAMMIKTPVKITRKIDSEIVQMFGNTAPSVRYGVYNYREFEIDLLPRPAYRVEGIPDVPAVGPADITTLDNLESVLAAAQSLAGVLSVRDTYGDIYYCALMPSRSWEHDLYQDYKLKLTEIQYTFIP